MIATLVDNDVLIKGCAFALWPLVPDEQLASLAILGAARYVVRDAINRHPHINDKEAALHQWAELAAAANELEPSHEELAAAIAFETDAVEMGIPLDLGESQLCAMALFRVGSVVLTGDKRAIRALEQLRSSNALVAKLDGRVVCLEQFVSWLCASVGADAVRARVCAQPGVDQALDNSLSCSSSDVAFSDAGLNSYVKDVRRGAPHILAATFTP